MFASLLPFYLVFALVIAAFVILGATVRILREYERAVVFTLGRFSKVKGPGLVLLLPFIQ
jgi:regulator of protease activity HflC (stomatin/prohibitin superfamily)